MIPVRSYEGQKVALFGLGVSGLSSAAALELGGAQVFVWDESGASRDVATSKGLTLLDLSSADFSQIDALVLSPGVPLTHPTPHWVVTRAREANVPIVGDTELFFAEFLARGLKASGDPLSEGHRPGDRVIVITGTNGKSTTTALTAHILTEAGERAVMGGNIGFGVLDMPDFGSGDGEGTVYVLELSSYQIDLTPSLKPTSAGLLNITPDHIDRHGTVANYAAVKGRIFDQLAVGGQAVCSVDDGYSKGIADKISPSANIHLVSSSIGIHQGVVLGDHGFQLLRGGQVRREINLGYIGTLRGKHNAQNAAFAYLLALPATSNEEGLIEGFNSFPGLAHRMRQVGVVQSGERRLLFVNDSKATNAEASEQALKSFDEIYWIAGGKGKAGGIKALMAFTASVKKAFLIGEAAADFAETLTIAGVDFEICGDMDAAVNAAVVAGLKVSSGEGAILLSPAAASFDQYPNFEIRGEAFCQAVGRVENIEMNVEASMKGGG